MQLCTVNTSEDARIGPSTFIAIVSGSDCFLNWDRQLYTDMKASTLQLCTLQNVQRPPFIYPMGASPAQVRMTS